MKSIICGIAGAAGTFIAHALGGWDASIIALLAFMAIDYITGFTVASVFHKSKKTESGGLQSRAGWKGLCKKCVTLLFVLIAHRLDLVLDTNYIRTATTIGFILNELISITENAGLMGIPLPQIITKAIEVLKHKSDNYEQ